MKVDISDIVDSYSDESFLIVDGFNDAIIGIYEGTMRVIYSVRKCLQILRKRDRMSGLEAVEFFDFNVRGAYMGERTPIWCQDTF